MAKDLTALISPKSVAVIGASRSPEKVGAIVLKNIIDSEFKGQIYPINPGAETLNNLKCYPDLNSLPEVPDLAVIALPSSLILETIDKVGDKGIKNVVIFAAGFKEIGKEGQDLENQLIEKASKYGINIIGPNCLGFINNLSPINATFGDIVKKPGNLRFISQSGAVATGLIDYFKSSGIGFAEVITLGNKANLNENDILEYYLNTPITINIDGLSGVSPIGLYLESISNGQEFLKITKEISKKNPIFIIKPGKSTAAVHAMQSHTGAIAGEDAVLDAALKESGIIRCQTLEDFFDLSKAFAWENVPEGPNVAIISNAGGPAVISADAVISEGLELVQFDDETKNKLSQVLPRSASVLNPVDVLGDALSDRFAQAAEIVLQSPLTQALIVILTPQLMTEIQQTAENLGILSSKYKKPILCSFIGGSRITEGEMILNRLMIPSFRFPERAISALGAMWRFKKFQITQATLTLEQIIQLEVNLEKSKEVVVNAVNNNKKTLDNLEADLVVSSAGIAAPPTQLVDNLDQAKDFTKNNGWPVVLKLSSPGLLHKKEVGGVITNILNAEQLETAWDKIENKITQLDTNIRDHVKVQIQKEILDGIEVIVGIKKDATFGPVLLFGAGGSMAEVIADRNLHLLPIDINEAKNIVAQSKIFKLLTGHQGEPTYALDKLYELIVRLSKLSELEQISDIEINPVIVTLNGVFAVDTKVILKTGETKLVPAGPRFKIAKTTEHNHLATTFHYFTFETETPINMEPGQYVSIKVANTRINCYSVARLDNPNKFHLLVNVAPGGPGSKFFENLKEGEKIAYLGPFGTFLFNPHDGSGHLIFLATGSGLAPFICMMDTILNKWNWQIPITLYLGLNTPEDVFWTDEFEKLKSEHPNFNYHLVVWKPNDSWQGETGFITDALRRDFPDTSGCSAYLCGNKNMIADATQIMLDHGCPKERIYTEKF